MWSRELCCRRENIVNSRHFTLLFYSKRSRKSPTMSEPAKTEETTVTGPVMSDPPLLRMAHHTSGRDGLGPVAKPIEAPVESLVEESLLKEIAVSTEKEVKVAPERPMMRMRHPSSGLEGNAILRKPAKKPEE